MSRHAKHRHRIFLVASQVVTAATLLDISPAALAEQDDFINPDRPGIADGSKVVGAGRFQIETGFQYESRQSGPVHDRRFLLPTLLRLGFGEKWEGRIESNAYNWKRLSETGNDAVRSEGSSPISLGMKYQWSPFNDAPQPSIGTIVRFFPVSGSSNYRSAHAMGDVRLAADWDFAPKWSLNPNIGVGAYEDDRNQLFAAGLFALTLNYNPTMTTNFFIDAGVQSPERKHGSSAVIVDAGLAILVTREIQLDFSVGRGTTGSTPPRSFVALGISMRF